MENRSFDHLLGWLKSTRPDIDGLSGTESNPVNVTDPNSPFISVSDDALFVDSDPSHFFQAIREQIFGSNNSSADSAPMNGFAQQAESMGEGMGRTVMSRFKPSRLPVYTKLANEFGVFDRWFASVPASTLPNRFYVHSATSFGATNIFDSLDENGLSFGIYYQNIPTTLFFKSLRKLKFLTKFHNYALKFRLHARLGKLPNYVVVEQRYFDVKEFPANDDHPSHDVARGQRFVKEVYEILRSSPQWKEMALLITYDEHGGFYDHVPTPVSGVPNPDGIIGPDPFYFKFNRLGVRVPTLLVSPWIDKATETLPEVTTSLRPWGPKEDTSLSEFQVELVQLASQLNGDYVLNTYPYTGKSMRVGEANRYVEDAVKRFLEAGKAAIRADANESEIVTMRPSLTSRIEDQSQHVEAY
ncbi:Phospholipase C 4 [Gossypium arboreum]|uniref:Phospholipase C 4 n=1 Tax=Gossypium arboreum TaxID=29729 RepID=A0A0B0P5S9_GOSAR|nr:Phospholipase C 4 [Gossypium arboreum]